MAVLCVRVADNRHPTDPSLDALRTQPGDVVEVVADGHAFSAGELGCGQYRFVSVPGVDPAEFDHLREPAMAKDEVTMLGLRRLRLDIAQMPALLTRAALAKGVSHIVLTVAQVNTLTKTRS